MSEKQDIAIHIAERICNELLLKGGVFERQDLVNVIRPYLKDLWQECERCGGSAQLESNAFDEPPETCPDCRWGFVPLKEATNES